MMQLKFRERGFPAPIVRWSSCSAALTRVLRRRRIFLIEEDVRTRCEHAKFVVKTSEFYRKKMKRLFVRCDEVIEVGIDALGCCKRWISIMRDAMTAVDSSCYA